MAQHLHGHPVWLCHGVSCTPATHPLIAPGQLQLGYLAIHKVEEDIVRGQSVEEGVDAARLEQPAGGKSDPGDASLLAVLIRLKNTK